MTFAPRRVLITGASSGIGAAFAQAFAARGSELVLVARREDRLRALADDLSERYSVAVEVVTADLGEPGSGARLRERTGPVDLLVNNAGFGTYGPFVDSDPVRIEQVINLDVRAVVSLTRAYLPGMIEERRGGVVNVASTAAYQPVPTMAVYAAAKAFVLNFTEAVWHEAKPHGVKVLSLAPGPTRTEFFDDLGMAKPVPDRALQSPEQVVETALDALDTAQTPPSVISGFGNTVGTWAARILPKRASLSLMSRVVE